MLRKFWKKFYVHWGNLSSFEVTFLANFQEILDIYILNNVKIQNATYKQYTVISKYLKAKSFGKFYIIYEKVKRCTVYYEIKISGNFIKKFFEKMLKKLRNSRQIVSSGILIP